MSNIEHVTGTAFVGADEAQYLTWLDGAASEQKRLEERIERMRRYIRASLALAESYPSMMDSPTNATRHGTLAEEFHDARRAMFAAGDLD